VDTCPNLVKDLKISTSSALDLPTFVVFHKGAEQARFANKFLSKVMSSFLVFIDLLSCPTHSSSEIQFCC